MDHTMHLVAVLATKRTASIFGQFFEQVLHEIHIICKIHKIKRGGYMSTILTINATDLVRNLSSTIDQVRISGKPLLITKGTKAVAELRPPPRVGFPIIRLQELLESLPKLGKEQKAMLRDMANVRKKAGLPQNPWA